jgi:perosamine synthetase
VNQQRSIPIALPSLGTEEWEAVREPLESGWVTQGPQVAAFERTFAQLHDVRFALATTSCTTALHLALDGLGLGPGDEVIVPAFTWVATPNAAVYCGATPVFADVDPLTYNLDPADVAAKLTERTRVVVPVHLFGLCMDVDALRTVLPPGVSVLEDAACAAGAQLGGRPAGGLGDVAAFSFHPRKSITTGEGGMVTTNDKDLAERMERRRNHGAAVSEEVRHNGPAPYLLPAFAEIGFNYRMTDVQAAIGLVQLGKLDRFIDERERWARWYDERLASLSWLLTPPRPATGRHGWQAYVTDVVEDEAPAPRNEMMARLLELGVSTRPGTHCAAGLDVYRRRRDPGHDSCPVSERLERTTMALPLHNRMEPEDYEHVAEALLSLED